MFMNWKKIFAKRIDNTKLLKQFKKFEPDVFELFSQGNHCVGNDYFRFIGQKLCDLTSADYIIIGKYNKISNSVESFVNCNKDTFFDNITYPLEGTPCKDVVGKKSCYITKAAWEQFPPNSPIMDREAEGYVGVPLFSSNHEPIGIVVALFKNPIEKLHQTIESLLFLFTPRLGTEMEHLQAREEIKKRNAELEIMHRTLKDKNKKLDYSVDELRKAQLKSKEYDQLKSTFLANLSHEIRTPMNVILGFLELLRSSSITVEEREEYIDIINFNGLQLLKVMDDLIDISKLQTRLMQGEYSKISLNDFMFQLEANFKEQAGMIKKEVNIHLSNELEDGKDIIVSDEEALAKTLRHLMDNALKFTKDRGNIFLGYEVTDDKLLFFVKDDGIGVQEGQESLIFDMFRQGQGSMSRQFGGNGLGLAISKKFVETLGGEIWLDNQYKDGAKFLFTIPYDSSIKKNNMHFRTQPLANQYL